MKRTLLSFIFVISCMAAAAQPSVICTDTVEGLKQDYYHPFWFNEAPEYTDTSLFGFTMLCDNRLPDQECLREYYTPQKLKIKGLTALIPIHCSDIHYPNFRIQNWYRKPEFLKIYQFSENGTDSIALNWQEFFLNQEQQIDVVEHDTIITAGLNLVDSTRWDTAAPYVIKLPRRKICENSPDSAKFFYCHVYEAFFKKPVEVDSLFFIAGTFNSNFDSLYGPGFDSYTYIPAFYIYFLSNFRCLDSEEWCKDPYPWMLEKSDKYRFTCGTTCGPYASFPGYFCIIDRYRLDVFSADSTLGTVEGGGMIPDGWNDTIRALPHEGFRFSHWNDGNTDNPRIVNVIHDTSYTAFFEEANTYYTLTLTANNPEWGSVEGGGSHLEQQPFEISATPAGNNCYFNMWSDGNLQNPRTISLTGDSTLTAVFGSTAAVDDADADAPLLLMPNPTDGKLTVKASSLLAEVSVYDPSGRLATRQQLPSPSATAVIDVSGLPSATYVLKAITVDGTILTGRFVRN